MREKGEEEKEEEKGEEEKEEERRQRRLWTGMRCHWVNSNGGEELWYCPANRVPQGCQGQNSYKGLHGGDLFGFLWNLC